MFEVTKKICQRFGIVFVTVVFLLGLVSAAWSLPADYNGTYYGTFSGDDSGVWVAVVNYSGDTVFLSYSTSSGEGDGGYMAYYGEAGTVGNYYTGSSVIQGSWVDAYIDSTDGSVSGDWGNTYYSEIGTISGSAYTTCSYAGTYSGRFSGDDSGSWTMTIAANGYVTGTISSDSGDTAFFEGGCHPDGHVIVVGEDSESVGFAFFGQISGSTVSGGWVSEDGYEGTVGSGSGGDDGGGGCFIMSLAGE